jgi:hypothetical protein
VGPVSGSRVSPVGTNSQPVKRPCSTKRAQYDESPTQTVLFAEEESDGGCYGDKAAQYCSKRVYDSLRPNTHVVSNIVNSPQSNLKFDGIAGYFGVVGEDKDSKCAGINRH